MSRYRSKVTRYENAQNRKAALKIAFVLIAIAGIVASYLWAAGPRRQLDEITLCPANVESVTIVLIDVTDPMNLAQRRDFINQLERLRSSIPRYGKLAIFEVDATSGRLLAPVIERCNPGRAADETEWTGNPQAAERRWQDEFERPLDDAFQSITAASGADRSPILESVQSIALTELQTLQAEGKQRRIVLASDLLQHTDRLSFYPPLPASDSVLSGDPFRMLRTDLRGVEVELWMLQRPDSQQSQPRDLITLWEAMIDEMGGVVTRAYVVSG